MKKGLLLSVVASGFIFAGGNIAPVQPVVPAAAPAACDFWGSVGARYEFKDAGVTGKKFGDKANNTWKTSVVLGVEKDLGYGFGFGAELGAYSHLGLTNIAGSTQNRAELSQLYVTYKVGNTAIKAGRQALPQSLSPWAFSDRTLGVLDNAYNGIVVVNTDIANTTLVGAWIASLTPKSTTYKVNGSDKGLFMLAAEYTGVANTTFDTSAYFIPSNGAKGKAFSVWASAKTKISGIDLGLQTAYAKADAGSIAILNGATGTKASYAISAYAGTKFNAFDAKLTLSFINDGDAQLNLGSSPYGLALDLSDTSGLWSEFSADALASEVVAGNKQKVAKLDLGYTLPSNYGKVYLDTIVDKPTTGKTAFGAALGYKFKVAGVNGKVEYRYIKNQKFTSSKAQRVRIEGTYKF